MKYLIIAIFSFLLGAIFKDRQDKSRLQKRIYTMYGEGDLGEQINYYLQTGDTSVQNYQ